MLSLSLSASSQATQSLCRILQFTSGFVWGAVVATRKPADIREVLASFQDRDIPKEFIERSKEYQK